MSIERRATSLISRKYEDEIEINLRSNCLNCMFFAACPIVEQDASPEPDVLIGSYRFSALKKRCLA